MQTTSNGESEHEGGQLYCRRYSHTGREQSCWMGLRQNLRFLRLFIIRHRRLHSLTPGRGSFPRNECNGDFSPTTLSIRFWHVSKLIRVLCHVSEQQICQVVRVFKKLVV